MSHPWIGAALAVVLATAAGCATRADLVQVQQDQREVRALLADQRVAMDGLRRRVEMLRARDAGKGSEPASRQVIQWLNELDTRLAVLEGRAGLTAPGGTEISTENLPGNGDGSAANQPTAPTTDLEVALAKEEQGLRQGSVDAQFRQALQLIRQSQCEQAVPMLREFTRKNPKAPTADNAQYWIGRCYYGQRDYNRAIIELNEVLLKYPKGDKLPAALLLLADAFADSGDKIDARLILQKLLSDHPQSEEAAVGRQRLQSLGE